MVYFLHLNECCYGFLLCVVKAGNSVVKIVHHQDLNKRVLIALIVASTVLGGLLLFLSCGWIYRHKKLRDSNGKNRMKTGKTCFSSNCLMNLVFRCFLIFVLFS